MEIKEVTAIETVHYEGLVYNLETETEQYIVEGICVHNCPHYWDLVAPKVPPEDCKNLWRPGGPSGGGVPSVPVEPVVVQRFGAAPIGADITTERVDKFLLKGIGDSKSAYGSETVQMQVKNELITTLSRETGLDYQEVNAVVAQWSKTSGGNELRSLYIQQDAATVLNRPLSKYHADAIKRLEARLPANMADRTPWETRIISSDKQQRLITAMKEHTASLLGEAGFESRDVIRLRRGLTLTETEFATLNAAIGDDISIVGNTLESWTSNTRMAEWFGSAKPGRVGLVLEMDVPVTSIIGTARTGFGALPVQEFVLTNSIEGNVARIVNLSK